MVATIESAVQDIISHLRDYYQSFIDPGCTSVSLLDTEDGEYILTSGQVGETSFIPSGVGFWKNLFDAIRELTGRVVRSVNIDFSNLNWSIA